jgi:DNA-binding GntR family transcriptional regulator
VEVGDAEGARRKMRAHLANTAKDIEAVLGEGALDTEPRGREEL